jgi:hypothetical protein
MPKWIQRNGGHILVEDDGVTLVANQTHTLAARKKWEKDFANEGGQPCGDSFISANKECRIGWSAGKGGKASSEGWKKTGESEKAMKIAHPEHGEHWLPKRGQVLDEAGKLTVTERGRQILEDKIAERKSTLESQKQAAAQDAQKEAAGETLGWKRNADGSSTFSGGKVIRETEKAILYSHPDFEDMWMPKSQVKMEGEKITVPKWLTDQKLQSRMFTPQPGSYTFAGETDKAWHLRVEYNAAHSSLQGDTSVFLPKSQVTRNADGSFNIPRWLAAAKDAEADGGPNAVKRGLAW